MYLSAATSSWGTPDVEAMKRAAADFLGTHDFIAFCSNKQFKKSSVRTITALAIETLDRRCALQ